MSNASIAIAASSRDWSMGLHRFVADHGGARVRLRVMHPEDALEEAYDVLVIDDITSFLSAHFVQQVQRMDRKVLGVYEEEAGEQRLEKLGVNGVISTSASPEDFVTAIVKLAEQRNVDEEFAELLAELRQDPDDSPAFGDSGTVIVVSGSGGGVGATEVAVAMAGELARRRVDTVLVDADDLAPAAAQRLDLPLHPNIRTAMDWLQHRSGSVEDALIHHPSGFAVLPGLPNARRWGDVRSGDAVDVVAELNRPGRAVVVNVSSMVEQDAAGVRGEGRFGVARLILSVAEQVVLVSGHSPMSVARTLDWVADTSSLIQNKSLHILVNRFEDSSFVRGEVEAELRSVIHPATVTFAPYDRGTVRAAWDGVPVGRNSFAKAIASLTDHLVPARSGKTRWLIGS